MNELAPINHENLSNTVYATLCDALISGKFKPGDRLRVRELAELLGTSVTPIRDAILRLTHDNAVVFQSPRNIQIPFLTEKAYFEIREIRVRLESLAAERAADLATPADIARLESILAESEKAFLERDGLRGAELNQAFHFALAQIAELPTLHNILRRLWLQMGPIIADVYTDAGRGMIMHHYDVLDAVKCRDGADAARAIADDIVKGGRAIRERIQAQG